MSEVLALRHKTFLSTNFAKERRNGTAFAGKNNFEEAKHEKKIVIGFSRCDDGADHGAGAFAADETNTTSVGSYEELVNAIASAENGATITVSGTIAIDAPLNITKSVTLKGDSIVPSENFSGSCLVTLETAGATLTLGDIKLDAKQKGRVIVLHGWYVGN